MSQSSDPQRDMQSALDKQRQNNQALDRILWIALPILAILLSTIFANWNIWSTLGTMIVLTLAFIYVGIKRVSLAVTLCFILLYCLVDNYLSYQQQFSIDGLKRQLLSMILFTSIVGLSRPMFERAKMKQ